MIAKATSQVYWGQVWNARHFLLCLVQLDLRNRYRRTVLGIGWALLNPICMMAVLCTVFHQIFHFPLREHIPFVMAGIGIWGFLSFSILDGCSSIYLGEKYIRSTPMPMSIYPLRTMMGLMLQFVIVLSLTILITLVLKGFPDPAVLLAILPALVLLAFFGWAMAVLFGFANIFFPDTHQIASVGMQMLFYLTPVFYPVEMVRVSFVQTCLRYNPFAALVSIVRDPLIYNTLPPLENYLYALFVTVFAVFCAVRLLAKCERTLIFHL